MAQIKEAPFIPNCCGRLYSILVQMKKKEGRTRSAIASVLRNGESSKDADLFAAAAELRALVDECSAAVEKHLEHTEMYTPALTKIVSVFHVIDLSSASSPLFVSSLNETDLVTLWHTARQLQLVLGADPSRSLHAGNCRSPHG